MSMSFEPAHPDYEAVVRASFERQGVMRLFRAALATVEPGHVVITVPYGPDVTQQQGFFHGAVMGAIGDTAGGYAALTLAPAGIEVLTIEYKINFVRPGRGLRLEADGRVLRAGRSVTTCRIDVNVIGEDGQSDVVAAVQATFMRVTPAA